MLFFRFIGGHKFKMSRTVLKKIGVFPIIKNYYEPIFDFDNLKNNLNSKRYLPGINFNTSNFLYFRTDHVLALSDSVLLPRTKAGSDQTIYLVDLSHMLSRFRLTHRF